tara:strand:+ start:126 stop:431 length:306 start_codon:yes stop_codon:yes gene_type:complete
MHENSLASFDENDRELIFSKREREILTAFENHGAMTDRQCLSACGYSDMNAVRPRISELILKGILREFSDAICPVTEKRVRICRIKSANPGEFLPGFGGAR